MKLLDAQNANEIRPEQIADPEVITQRKEVVLRGANIIQGNLYRNFSESWQASVSVDQSVEAVAKVEITAANPLPSSITGQVVHQEMSGIDAIRATVDAEAAKVGVPRDLSEIS